MRGGGAERVLINLFGLIDLNLYHIELIVLEDKGVLWAHIPKGINKKVLFPNKYISKIAILFYRKLGFNKLMKYYGKQITGRYNLAISFLDSVYTEFLFLNDADIQRKAVVIHSSYKSYPQKFKFLENIEYRKKVYKRFVNVDTIITVSKESLSEFVEIFGSLPDMRVFYNPINKSDIILKSDSYVPNELRRNNFNFIAIGSLIPVKGFDLLIDACSYLKGSQYNFTLNILGSGPLYEDLMIHINKKHLPKHVFLRGFVENPYPWLKGSQALVMTSITEGLPTVLCEAMTLGIPTITPNVPGCREIVENGKYGLVYERNAEALYCQMKNILSNNDLAKELSVKSIERSKIFNDQEILEKYYELFNS